MWGALSDESSPLPLGYVSAVILWRELLRIRDHNLLYPIGGSSNVEDHVAVFMFPRNTVVQLYSEHWITKQWSL
jgi:hypothetical protein